MARIVSQPELHRRYQRGIQQMVNAIRPTLGPLARNVGIDRIIGSSKPEILDDGGVIARRIIELPQRSENSGAMMLRHLLWRVHESVGDGTATSAVIFETIFNEGLRYLAAGGNAMSLRGHLESGGEGILAALEQQTQPLQGAANLSHVARSICHDEELAAALGEIFAVIGPFGQIETRLGRSRGLETSYIDGIYWKTTVLSKAMLRDKMTNQRNLKNLAICISDLDVTDPHDLIPVMEQSLRNGAEGLVIVVKSMSEALQGLIVTNEKPGRFDIVAVKLPGLKRGDQAAFLDDLALLTGGRALLQATGDSLAQVTWDDLGHSRRAWVDADYFGIVGGEGDAYALRQHVERLISHYPSVDEPDDRKSMLARIGRLQGGAAVLRIGGITEQDSKTRKELADRTVSALRGAMQDGILPGGGVALRACQEAVRVEDVQDPDARAAQRILQAALEAPMRAILRNAGWDDSTVLARLQSPQEGFDVLRGEVVDMQTHGIFDSAAVVKMALRTAISGAALALTTDTIIHQKQAPQGVTP